jgi:hypothetical protein
VNDDELSELIERRAGLIEARSAVNRQLTGLNQAIAAEMTRRGLDRYDGAVLTRRSHFRPFVAQDLIDKAGLSSTERAALTKEVIDVGALKELRPDIYDQACEPGEPYLVQRVRSDGEDEDL